MRARALSGDARGHLRVSDVLLDGPRKKRTARSLAFVCAQVSSGNCEAMES